MPVTFSNLLAKGAITNPLISNEAGSSLEVYRNSFAAQRDRTVDIFKNSGLQMATLNAFSGLSMKSAFALNELYRGPAIEARRAADRLMGPSVLQFTRIVQEMSENAQFVKQLPVFNSAGLFADQDLARLADTSRLISSQFSVLDGLVASAALRRATLFGVRGWETAAAAFVQRPDAHRLLPLQGFGRGTLGVTSATALLADLDDVAAMDEPALLGPAWVSEALRKSLDSLDPRLSRRLDGAWERVSRRGPDAASQAAHSLMEAIDWSLRLAAPDDPVLAWHTAERRPDKELCNGRPTRGLRVHFLLRGRPGEADAARFHLRALSGLVDVIQSYKHSEDEADIEAVARLIPTVEGLLIFVLGVSPGCD